MTRTWMFSVACSLGLLLNAAPSMAGTSKLPADAVLIEPETRHGAADKAQALRSRVLTALASGDNEAVLRALRAESDPVARESAAVGVIDAIQQAGPDAASERLLTALEQEPVRVFQRHEETAADWFLPVFNVPARAASARDLFAAAARRSALQATLERDPRAAGQAKDAATLAAAIDGLSPAGLQKLRDAALRGQISLPGAAWVALTRRSPDPSLLAAVLTRAEPLDLLPLMQELPQQLSPATALQWLESAANRPALASAAVLGIGTLVPRLPKAETVLAGHLGNPATGASAAAALAQLAMPDRLKRIDLWIARAEQGPQLHDLALALRLEGSPAAQDRLRRLAEDERLSASLRKELQR